MAKWAKIEGYKPIYYVSDSGMVKSIERETRCNTGIGMRKERILKTSYVRKYLQVFLYDESGKRHTVLVHRLVANAFIENPEKMREVDHIDGNPENNQVENLRWVTHKENCNNENTIIKKIGVPSKKRKMVMCFNAEKKLIAIYDSVTEAAKHNKTTRHIICNGCKDVKKNIHGLTFKYL